MSVGQTITNGACVLTFNFTGHSKIERVSFLMLTVVNLTLLLSQAIGQLTIHQPVTLRLLLRTDYKLVLSDQKSDTVR